MNWLNDSVWQPVALLLAAGILHACYQMRLNVLTLLSNHTLGLGSSNTRLLSMGLWYVAGVFATTWAMLLGLLYVCATFSPRHQTIWWLLAGAIAVAAGVFALIAHLRAKIHGTHLGWIPHPVADYLLSRSKKTRSGTEAFSLGFITVCAELPLAVAPLFITALLIGTHTTGWGFDLSLLYASLIALPLLFMLAMIGGGTKVSQLQRWREDNQGFLQFLAGSGMIVVGLLLLLSFTSWGRLS